MISTNDDNNRDMLSKQKGGVVSEIFHTKYESDGFIIRAPESTKINAKTVEAKFLPSISKNDKMVQQKPAEQSNRRTVDTFEDSFNECDRLISSSNLEKISKDNFNRNARAGLQESISERVINVNCDDNDIRTKCEAVIKRSKLEESLRKSLEIVDDKPTRYEKGMTKSTTHLILEMNEFYFDMAEQLRYLKTNLQSSSRKTNEDELSETSDWNYATTDPKLLDIIEKIEKDEIKMAECVRILKKEKEERLAIEEEICSIVDGPISEGDGLADDYLHVTCFQSPDCEVPNLEEETKIEPIEEQKERKTKKTNGSDKDFVEKNKKLAKEYTMSRYCLTDEEKIKLDILLADIDECGDADPNETNTGIQSIPTEVNTESLKEVNTHPLNEVNSTQSCDIERSNDEVDDNEQVMNHINGFKLEVDEESLLSDVDSKLKVVSEITEVGELIDLKAAESKGKYWKLQLMQKRLNTIETSLVELQEAKDKDCEDIKEFEENYDECERNIREKIYRESLDECGLKIEDIEKEIDLECNESVHDEKIVNDDVEIA